MTRIDEPIVYDYAIVGAGVSGLTLAWLLGESALAERSILLIDGVRDDDELRTLSFWSSAPLPQDELVAHRWRTLRFESPGGGTDLPLEEHTYQTLFFADLQRETKRRLSARPANRVVDGRLERMIEDDDGATLFASGECFRARWVFDSRFRRRDLKIDARHHALEQHFHGWLVRTPIDAFDPEVATWLDFRAGGPPGTQFFYLLPFSRREALVELVSLSAIDAEPLLRAYLAREHGQPEVELVDEEAGVSPMTEQPFSWRGGRRVRRIGVAAGRLKPSTGYALTRIVQDCTGIVRSLEQTGHPWIAPPRSWLFGILDALLLEIWQETPAEIPGVFAALLARNPIDLVLRFLDERATLVEIARLGWVLPKWVFVRAALRWIARSVAGEGQA